jgi:hypothetical protein
MVEGRASLRLGARRGWVRLGSSHYDGVARYDDVVRYGSVVKYGGVVGYGGVVRYGGERLLCNKEKSWNGKGKV